MLVRVGAVVRSAFVIGGLAFAAIEVASACLDHAGEELSQCHPEGGADCGAAAAPTGGSGSGSGTTR